MEKRDRRVDVKDKYVQNNHRKILYDIYIKYNHREFVHPDPIEFLYNYKSLRDREVVALIASALAYGRVTQILKSVSSILKIMEPSPFLFLNNISRRAIYLKFSTFKHRFTTGKEVSEMLYGIKLVIERYGSLYKCFMSGFNNNDNTILPALTPFINELTLFYDRRQNSLLPSPKKGSACKRLNLFLRWMVRHDEVDPGGWDEVPASKLVIPLDTHMHRISLLLKLTERKQADRKTALEITYAFRKIIPEDPVRYDFALTRLGIRKENFKDIFKNLQP
jgi:uncharacterized protein (TIGR02757 family)